MIQDVWTRETLNAACALAHSDNERLRVVPEKPVEVELPLLQDASLIVHCDYRLHRGFSGESDHFRPRVTVDNVRKVAECFSIDEKRAFLLIRDTLGKFSHKQHQYLAGRGARVAISLMKPSSNVLLAEALA